MSLLTSLIKASTQFQGAMEKRPSQAAEQGVEKPAGMQAGQTVGSASDDRFTLSADGLVNPRNLKSNRLAVTEYKQNVGQDLAFVRETLRHKLAEYGLGPNTRVGVTKGEEGGIKVEGRMPEKNRQQIEQDLNNSKAFREAFNRLSVNEPTLHFVDNALKLNKAYGVNNSLLDTLVSDNQQFNGLQDLVHRYDSIRRTVSAEQIEAAGNQRNYAFSLNTRA